MILVIAEQRDGKLNRATWEAVAAGQELAAGQGPSSLSILVLGANVGAVAAELSGADAQAVITIDRRSSPTPPTGSQRRSRRRLASSPTTVILPHTYQTPRLRAEARSRLIGRSSPT